MRKWLLLVVLLLAPCASRAAESGRVVSPRDTVSLVSAARAVDGDRIRLGLLFRLAPGWHIYWKDAGDAGEPPGLRLTAPKGAKAGAFSWPAPSWMVQGPVGDYVETGTVLLPFTMRLAHEPSTKGVEIAASATWLVCNPKICVPEQGRFTLHLPRGAAIPSRQAGLFAEAAAKLPRPSPFAVRIAPEGTMIVSGRGLGRANVKAAHFYPDNVNAIANSAPQRLSFTRGGFLLRLKPAGWKPGAPLTGVLEIIDPSGQMQALTVSASPAGTAPAAAHRVPLTAFLLGAFLGGLILNLMPCVFPILAMKALAVARLSVADRRGVRVQSLAYAAGAVVAMLAIGALLIALRAGGASLGWGFQFQSPVFVAVMAWLVFAIGLNFAGLFEFGFGFVSLGAEVAQRGGIPGSFATGMLAVVVATPCTAPFMGGAIAAALAAPAPAALGIFAALGFGLALPFLMIGFIPGLGRVLPRPGAWMLVLRQFLAFPMFGTAAWLLWVMTQEAGADGALILAGGAVLIAFGLWLLRFQGMLPRGLAVLAAIALIGLLPRIIPAQAAARLSLPGAVPYSAARLAALRAEGKPVFIDMSAAWCVTCLVNERVALEPARVRQAFAARRVTLMLGDWTRRNAAITRYLAAHGREGVPLYVYYPPAHAAPEILPQILTPRIVLRALGK
ncbi:MAG TPA: thioredoxin family protein [Acetobacteraceae bacterium]|nr:thioredoxin family protein [Acetobacteraceae bacterium]